MKQEMEKIVYKINEVIDEIKSDLGRIFIQVGEPLEWDQNEIDKLFSYRHAYEQLLTAHLAVLCAKDYAGVK